MRVKKKKRLETSKAMTVDRYRSDNNVSRMKK